MEVKRYRFLATLDAATCTVCGKLDNKTFDVSEARQGVNYPPMHPNDRCTTVEAFDGEDLSKLKRRARDPETGKTYLVPADMNYEQWRKQDTEKRGYDAVKAAQNAKSDKEQYSRYKKLLGKENVPKTLAEFQKMKYDIHGAEEYKALKSKYRTAISPSPAQILSKKIAEGSITLTINHEKQARHIKDSKGYIEGRSYLTISESEAQELVNQMSCTGQVIISKNGQIKEIIKADHDVGVCIDSQTFTEELSNSLTIHYSKTGTHVVPAKRR